MVVIIFIWWKIIVDEVGIFLNYGILDSFLVEEQLLKGIIVGYKMDDVQDLVNFILS